MVLSGVLQVMISGQTVRLLTLSWSVVTCQIRQIDGPVLDYPRCTMLVGLLSATKHFLLSSLVERTKRGLIDLPSS